MCHHSGAEKHPADFPGLPISKSANIAIIVIGPVRRSCFDLPGPAEFGLPGQ